MPEWIETVVSWLTYREVRAIIIGLVISWNATQIIKNAPALVSLPEPSRRWRTRAIAFALGLAPTAMLWPGPIDERALVGIAVGLAAPAVYTYGARVLYHYFPWLEPKMSASPSAEPRT